MQGFRMGQMPRTMGSTGSVGCQLGPYTKLNQHCPSAARGFPLPPQRHPKTQTNPASQLDQHVRRFAEAEIATPTSHIRGQSCHCRLQAHAFSVSRDFPNPLLKPLDGLRRNPTPNLRTISETESEKLALLRSRHRTLLVVHLELESLCDELRDAVHHPLTRPFGTDVDVAIVRISNKPVSPALQLPVEFVEHEVTEQGRKWASLRSPLHAGTDQPVLHHSGIQECADELQQPLIPDSFRNLIHQFVVIDSIEEFLQIELHDPAVACSDVLLRLRHCLMSRATRPEAVVAVGERRVPLPLQNLRHRLLDKSVQRGRNAELAHSSVRFGYFYPFHRLWFIGPTQQLFPYNQECRIVGEFIDGHAIDPRATLVGLDSPDCLLQVFPLTYRLHYSIRAGWVFGFILRPGRFRLFPVGFSGFTRQRGREVQLLLDSLLLVALEIHDLITLISFRPSVRVPGLAYLFAPPFGSECLTSLA